MSVKVIEVSEKVHKTAKLMALHKEMSMKDYIGALVYLDKMKFDEKVKRENK